MPGEPTHEELLYQAQHKSDDKRSEILASHIICFTLACIAISLRFFSRKISKVKYGPDDWLICGGLVFTAGVMSCNYIGLHFGLGRHVILASNVPGFAQTLIAAEAIYNFAMLCIKFSILHLYRRIFFVSNAFMIAYWAIGAFVLGYSIAQTFAAIFQCVPVRSLWDPSVEGHCIDTALAATLLAAFNVVTDVAILILPMPILWSMQMSVQQKLQITGMFLLGGFVCVASIYRCVVIHTLSKSDPTWLDVPTDVWTMAELGVAIIAACLPTFKPLFHQRHRKSSSNSEMTTPGGTKGQSNANLSLHQSRSNPAQSAKFEHLGVLANMEDLEAAKKPAFRIEGW